MSIHLYLSAAAGGKTAFAVAQARQAAGTRCGTVMVCVANQLQRWAWKERLAEAGGALGVQVLTFGQLHRALLRESGQAIILLDDAMQHCLLRRTLDGADLDHYRPLLAKPGFVVLLHNLIAELKAARIDPQTLGSAVAALGNEQRLSELVQIYDAYQHALRANDWADEEELGLLALRVLQDQPRLATDWALLVVDGFDNLTTVQRDLLCMLARRGRETIITLSGVVGEPARGLVHRRFGATRRALETALQVHAEPLPPGGQGRADGDLSKQPWAAEALVHLERSLFVSRGGSCGSADGTEARSPVALLAAADRAGEVRAALRWLKARLVQDGCRPAEVALLARRIAPYRALIQETAQEFGIPILLLDGLPLAGNPAVAALTDLLRLWLPLATAVAEPSFPRRLVVEAWRSPYLDWGVVHPQVRCAAPEAAETPSGGGQAEPDSYATLADALDSLARWGQVMGGLAQWREALARRLAAEERGEGHEEEGLPSDLPSAAETRLVDEAFERFVRRLTPQATDSMSDYIAWLEALIGSDSGESEELDDSLRMVECARRGDVISAQRDLAALRALKDVLRGLVWAEQVLGTPAPGTYREFYNQYRAAVEAAVYSLPHKDAGDQVLVADVVQARGVPWRAVAVLGLAEGEFPVTLQEDPLLRDSDRQRLRAKGLDLPPSTESAEAEYFYETVTRARDRLLLTRPRLAENGAIWEPSPYWDEVCRLVSVKPQVLGSEGRVRPDEAASWPELLEGLAACPDGSPWHAWASARGEARYHAWQDAGAVFRARYARRPAGPYNGDLSERVAELGKTYGPGRVWSASRLESYRTCPGMFFVGAALGLQPRQEPVEGLEAYQLGNIFHCLFQRVYETCPPDARNDAGRLLEALDKVSGGVLAEAPQREGFRQTAWWRQTQDEILMQVRRSLQELASLAGDYTTTDLERTFDATPIWQSPDGQDMLLLRGTVDRVDRRADGALRIIDYKTAGPGHFGPRDLKEGRKLQLPLYALAMRQVLGGEINDGFYWHVRQAEPSKLRLETYGVSQSEADAQRYAREAVEGIRRGGFSPHPPAEGCPAYCPAATFCWAFRPGYGG